VSAPEQKLQSVETMIAALEAEAERWRKMGGSGETVAGYQDAAKFLAKRFASELKPIEAPALLLDGKELGL
jgi:hypothetical protein